MQTLGPQHFPFVPRCFGVRNFVVNTAVPQVGEMFVSCVLFLLGRWGVFFRFLQKAWRFEPKVCSFYAFFVICLLVYDPLLSVLPHLVLEDVTAPYDEPSVLDVKIGLITYDPNTSDLEKIESQRKKYPHQAEMGYSVAGMRVYNTVTKSYETRNRQWGRALRRPQV